MRKLLLHAPLAADKPGTAWDDPHTKVNALLQAHFGRAQLPADLGADLRTLLPDATRLLQVWLHRCLQAGCVACAGCGVAIRSALFNCCRCGCVAACRILHCRVPYD